jgi:hypothetical protein
MIDFMIDRRYKEAYPEKEKEFSQINNDSIVEIFKNQERNVSIRIGDNLWTIENFQSSASTVINKLINQLASDGYRVIKKSRTSGTLQRDKESQIDLWDHYFIPKKIGGKSIELPSTGSCFIATAAYGSSLSPQVMELRCFRDNVLLNYRLGKLVVKYYELISPPLAHCIGKSYVLQSAVRTVVIRPVIFFIV